MKEKLHDFKRHCHKHGLRVTPQRVAIYKKLVASDKHPSATEIHRQIKREFPNVSLGTVNSTLITFAKIGLARIVESSGDPKRFDPDTEMHHHFRCVKCNRIIDFHEKTYDNIRVPAEIATKYLILGKKVYLEGLCDKCQTKGKANP
ncbi:Fur family transcriptional regulator [candidate division WOR_3 bacterium SM23_42]|uniref:Fur family transcriptional regulator n=1 Tax=candidate division WOR_3 bacterium SM23_42 TaxID=1703779 RepID=A0A0S8FUU7_UNCW3|nr:MAG: Fur family transcriptional regulator [candidate division WOR_3 bacterium SM23_42]